MAEETVNPNTPQSSSAPIVPSFREALAGSDALALLKQPLPQPIVTPVVPPIPQGTPPAISINEQIQGDLKSGPVPGAKGNNLKGGTADFVKAVAQYMKDPSTVRDRYKYGRTYSFGAGYKNMNFDRYYNHPKFEQLGFSPFRDNDTHYNENSSWWDDFQRMGTQWGSLAWGGFKSIWGSEEAANETMEKGMAIGSSSRGGLGGWVTNFTLNSAYTVGVMAEIALEDFALLGVEALSFGTATPLVADAAVVRNSMAFGRLAKAWSGTYDFMKSLRSIDKAKDFFNAAKLGEKGIDAMKFINPLERTRQFGMDLYKGTNGVKNLSNMAKVTRGFGNFYRDMREVNTALSEGALEGQGAMERYFQQRMDEFYAENGRMPEGKEAELIWKDAHSVKSAVTMANLPTIYYTNKLVFEDLFEGFRPGAKIAEGFLEGTGRFMKRAEAKSYKVGQNIVEAGEKTGMQKTKDFLLKSAYVPWSQKYILGNLSEGFQESSQEVIQSAVVDYYDKIHKDPTQVGFYSALGSIGKGMGEQFSGQGLDTFFQGFLMGSLIQGPSGALEGAYNKVTGKSKTIREQQEENDNATLEAANHVGKNALIFGDDTVNMATAVKMANAEKKKAAAAGDTLTEKDMETMVQAKYFHHLAKTGNMGLITEHVDDMLTLSDKEIAEAYNLSEDQGAAARKKLETLKSRAERYQARFEYASKKMPNPANPWMFSKKDKNGNLVYEQEFNEEMVRYKSHENAMADLLFAFEDHSRVAERMESIGQNLAGQTSMFQNLINVMKGGTKVANAAGQDVAQLIDPAQMQLNAAAMEAQIDALETGGPEQKKQAQELRTQLELMNEWRRMVQNFQNEMASEDKAQFSPEEREARTKAARVRAGATVKDKNGKEYKVDSVSGGDAIIHVGGNKYKRVKRRNLEVVKDAPGARPMEFEAIEEDELSFAISQMYDVYEKYLRHVAKMKNGYVFDDQLNEAFRQIKDYFILERNNVKMASTINRLSDPDYFNRYTELLAQAEKIAQANKLKNLEAALKDFKDRASRNKMLNELYDLGLFALPESIDELLNFEVVDFYDEASKEKVPYGSDKYKKAVEIIERYAQEVGKTATGKGIAEAGTDEEAKERAKYSGATRKKLANDNRKYSDHAKQFGFNPTAPKTEVSAAEVLKKIATSRHATAAEKALARRLLTALQPGTKITFVNNNSTPGVYKGATKEIIVDARYSSEDFEKGGIPLEFVILHEVMHALTVEGLNTDQEFMSQIEKLREAAIAFQQTEAGKAIFGQKPLYGTMNAAEFVSEAMANPVFQGMLRQIPTQSKAGKPSSAWNDFLDTVRNFFSKLLGVSPQHTVLDEAMNIIAAQIDKGPIVKEKPATETASKKKISEKVGTTTPIEQLKLEHPDLVNKLIEAYHSYNKDNGLPADNRSFEEITKSDRFKKFVTETGSAFDIFEEYNKPTAGQKPAQPKPIQREKKAPNIWATGNRWIFSGSTDHPTRDKMQDVPVEVMEERKGLDPDSQEEIWEVILKDLNTGEEFPVNLLEQGKDFKVVPIPTSATGQQVAQETISDAAYKDFVDNNKVSDEILSKIAEKTKDRLLLSPRELEIFTAKTAEINEILRNIAQEQTYKGIRVVDDLTIKTQTGEPGGAAYRKETQTIHLNRPLLRQKFEEKAWTKPRRQKDGSTAKAFPVDQFSSYEEWERFVMEHEWQHDQLRHEDFKKANPGSSIAEYEDEINRRALKELNLLKEAPVGEEEKSLMEAYDDITNKVELDAWKVRASDALSNSKLRKAISEQEGVDFNSDYVTALVEAKEKNLATSLNFEDLNLGTIVIMKNNKEMVVTARDEKNVTLTPLDQYKAGDPGAGKKIIAKSQIKNEIKMRHSEFIEKAEAEEPLSQDQIKESDEALKNAVEDETSEIKDDIQKSENMTADQAMNDLLNSIKKCKRGE